MGSNWTPSVVGQTSDDERTLLARILAAQGGGGQSGWIDYLPSASRTTNTLGAEIDCSGYSAILFRVDVTVRTGASSITAGIVDTISTGLGWDYSSSIAAASLRLVAFWPSPAVALTGRFEARSLAIPSVIRLLVVHANADAITYEVKYQLIP